MRGEKSRAQAEYTQRGGLPGGKAEKAPCELETNGVRLAFDAGRRFLQPSGAALGLRRRRTVLEYTSERVRLDLGRRQVQVLGDGLCLGGFTGRSLLIRGTVIRIELTEKEREET